MIQLSSQAQSPPSPRSAALPIGSDVLAVAHQIAVHEFDVFVQMAFRVLEPGTSLIWSWYLEAMAGALMDVERGDSLRLLITIPPRHLKSLMASVMFPAWVLGRDPTQKFLCVSYAQDLSSLHSRAFRRLIQSNFYRAVFPATAGSFIRTAEDDLQTLQGGARRSTSLGGTVTGLGADYILIDDLMKAQEASFPEARARARQFVDDTLLSRLNDRAKGRIVSIQQRLHADDIVAHFKEKGGFRQLELPATAVRDQTIPLCRGKVHHRKIGELLRETAETLEKTRKEMGNRAFQAQFQQDPDAAGSIYVQWEKLHFYDSAPETYQIVVQSWDTAASEEPGADYSVCSTWGYDGKAWLLLDIMRDKLLYPDLLQRARVLRKHWRAQVILVENIGVGAALCADLGRDWQQRSLRIEDHAPNCQPIAIQSVGAKEERMMGQVQRLYEGFALLPRQAAFLDDLRKEVRSFPGGKHDDQVDSISQFLKYAVTRDASFLNPGVRQPSRRQPGIPRYAR